MDVMHVVCLDTEVAVYRGDDLVFAGHGDSYTFAKALCLSSHEVWACYPQGDMKTWQLPHSFQEFHDTYPQLTWQTLAKIPFLLKLSMKTIPTPTPDPSLEDLITELLGEVEINTSADASGALQAFVPSETSPKKLRLIMWQTWDERYEVNMYHFMVKSKTDTLLMGSGKYKILMGWLTPVFETHKVL